jgi:precorrin-2 methylase
MVPLGHALIADSIAGVSSMLLDPPAVGVHVEAAAESVAAATRPTDVTDANDKSQRMQTMLIMKMNKYIQ